MSEIKTLFLLGSSLVASIWMVPVAQAGSVIIVANGASTGPIITTSAGTNLSLGTQLRVGVFANTINLNNAISTWNAGTTANSAGEVATARTSLFNSVVNSLNSNFTDIGTLGGNYGNASQTGTGVATNKFVINTTASLTVNGASGTYNVANGQIQNVAFSAASGIGNSKSLWIWATFNEQIGIFTDSAWVTPASDLSNVTLNLNAISNLAAEVLLGNYIDNATGNDFLSLGATTVTVVPEPSVTSLLLLGLTSVLCARRKKRYKS